ncbi:MAG: DUF362 domain-containing protein [Candidatus Eisenbacteria bacterium]|nr:DUF362 domain-containing protein [Candidatus Eisenbacteria bacterium]
MSSTVYLFRHTDWKDLEAAAGGAARLLSETDLLELVEADDLTGVKLTFGEAGNQTYPPPRLVREIVDLLRQRGARPFLTETNTLYNGRRKNSVDHLTVAREHGFDFDAIGAPIILGDGLTGREGFALVRSSGLVPVAHLSPAVRDMHSLVGIAHLTGHLLTGFGGAIKNLGMGLANRAGKLDMHSAVSPTVDEESCILCLRCLEACAADAITEAPQSAVIDAKRCTGCADCLAVCPTGAIRIDWSRDSLRVQQKMAEYADAVREAMGGRALYLNLLQSVTKHCDCLGEPPERIAPDVGVAASRDPVALDQASLDLVREAAGEDVFRRVWPETDPEAQIRHGEEIGLGKRAYDLREL